MGRLRGSFKFRLCEIEQSRFQRCDNFTFDLLNLLAFRCSPAKMLVVVGYRPENTPANAFIDSMLRELRPRKLCLALSLDNDKEVSPPDSQPETKTQYTLIVQ